MIDGIFCPATDPSVAAHLVNHPGRGMKANVIERDFKWKDIIKCSRENEVFNSVVEGPWFADPITGKCYDHVEFDKVNLVGICFQSITAIEAGDELYFDYNINKKFRPSWYPED